MCKLVTITKTEGENKEAETLLRLQLAELKTQKDGCAGLTIGFDNKIKVYRELEDYDKVFQAVLADMPTSKLVSLHTRIGTSGEKDLANVHFFKPKDWYFAHNGFVEKYHRSQYNFGFQPSYTTLWDRKDDDDMDYPPYAIESGEVTEMINCSGCYTSKKGFCKIHEPLVSEIRKKETLRLSENTKSKKGGKKVVVKQAYCDSYQFIQNMPEITDAKVIEKFADKTSFNGMGLLVHENGKDVYLIIAKPCHAVTDRNTFAGFFSYEPELRVNMKTESEVCGVKINSKRITLSVNERSEEIVRGIYHLFPDKIN